MPKALDTEASRYCSNGCRSFGNRANAVAARQIDLSRTQITDLALEYLATMKTLDLVEIQDTPTSESGAQKLHTALAPHCTVYAADGSCLVADRYRQ